MRVAQANRTSPRQIEDYRPGYPQFSALISSHPSFLIYRRFLRIRARLLLLKQDELLLLESQLDKVDEEETRELFLGNARRDANPERQMILSKLVAALHDYDALLHQNTTALAHDHPRRDEIANLQNWLSNTASLTKEEIAYLSYTPDLMTLACPGDNALAGLMPITEWIMRGLLKVFRKTDHGASRDPHVSILSVSLLRKSTRMLFAWIVMVLLLTPIAILSVLTHMVLRLVVIVVASTRLIILLSLFTSAKSFEVLLASVTYAAVLVVFISSDAAKGFVSPQNGT